MEKTWNVYIKKNGNQSIKKNNYILEIEEIIKPEIINVVLIMI